MVTGYKPEHYCEVRTQDQHEQSVWHFVTRARDLGLCPIVAAETWTPGRWGFDTILGMGEGWGWWTAELRRAQERLGIPPIYIERVIPKVWRDDLFGKAGRDPDGKEMKRQAVHYVQAVSKLRVPEDVAESLCVGYWAAQRESVHEAVRKWRKKQR